ncbi:MAG: T9SS type A sorting domain-containing protein [Chitinophagales bacterium]|jgi:hypothetical protein
MKLPKIFFLIAILGILPCVSNAQFTSKQTINATESGESIYAVDLDQDNDIDIISALESNNKLVWYKNLGSGMFSASNLLSDSVSSPRQVIAADLNNDAKQDIISANSGDGSISWFKNLGSGTFSSKITITNSALDIRSICTADVDNDGDLDLLSGSYFPNGMVAWYANNGSGNFGPQQIISNSSIDVKTIVASDLNNDSLPDVLVASFNLGDVKWFKNLGGGLFDSGQNIGWSFYTIEACSGDLDADGDNDVVASNGAEIFIHENLGNGLFANQPIVVTSTTSSYGGKISLFDIDSDGLLDILPAEIGHYRVTYYKNLGSLGFSQPIIVDSVSGLCRDTHSADLDNDGDMDIIASFELAYPDDKLVWYKNNNTLSNVNELNSTLKFAIYPNPSTEHLTIKLIDNISNINQLSVFDVLGKEYHLVDKKVGHSEIWINVSNLSSGVYLLKFQTDDGKLYHGEFIKQ